MPLGYVPGSHPGCWNTLSHRLFGSRRFSRAIEFRIILAWLPDEKLQVLDVATGSGELAQQLALRGHSLTALDYDADLLRHVNRPGVPPIRVVSADAHLLPFTDSSFDLVVSNSALEHFTNDEVALSEMVRVLRRNGRLILTTDSFPSQVSSWVRFFPKSWWRADINYYQRGLSTAMQSFHQQRHGVVNYYSQPVLTRKLRRRGLTILDSRYYLNGPVSKAIFEAHILLRFLDFYNGLSRRLFPLFYPFTFPVRRRTEGYGLAVCACKTADL